MCSSCDSNIDHPRMHIVLMDAETMQSPILCRVKFPFSITPAGHSHCFQQKEIGKLQCGLSHRVMNNYRKIQVCYPPSDQTVAW